MLFWVCSLNSTEGLGIGLSVVIIYINNKYTSCVAERSSIEFSMKACLLLLEESNLRRMNIML